MSRRTQDPPGEVTVSPTGFSPSLTDFPKSFGYCVLSRMGVLLPHGACTMVWALPRSLAAT